MAQAGFTPIQLYYSSTATNAPSAGNLIAGELALNTADMKLYAKNNAGVVTLLASSASSSATVSSVAVSGGTTGLTTSGGPITTSGTITLAGTLAVTNGGTGVGTLTGIVKGNGTSAFTAAVAGTDFAAPTSGTRLLYGNGAGGFSNVDAPVTGYVLGWSGSAYNWVVAPAAITAADLAGGSGGGQVVYQNGTDDTRFTAAGVTGQALISNGTAAPAFGVTAIVGGGTNSTATPTAGAVPYGTGTAYAFTTAGSAGQVLQSNGASAPAWVNASTIGVSTAKVYFMAQF